MRSMRRLMDFYPKKTDIKESEASSCEQRYESGMGRDGACVYMRVVTFWHQTNNCLPNVLTLAIGQAVRVRGMEPCVTTIINMCW
jgi:hypothetical protein